MASFFSRNRILKNGFTPPPRCFPAAKGGTSPGAQNRRFLRLKYQSMVGGFTFTETLVGVAVFVIVGITAYQVYARMIEVVRISRLKVIATALANEQFEIARNLPYTDVGILGGLPAGKLLHDQTLVRDNISFQVTTTVRSTDDPFDGTIGGVPNDTSPADYKLVAVDITCPTCKNFTPLSFTTHVGPRALETSSTNGALFVQVFDANGQPVPGANVHIENNAEIPPISIDDTTNNSGLLEVVDAPPGAEVYEITVTKAGYSTEQTYLMGDPGNPNPTKPHATVATGQLTQISFAIDRTSTLNSTSMRDTCTPVGNQDFSLAGSKLIGTTPDVLKYNANHVTNGSGALTVSGLEWDTYSLTFTDGVYDLKGTIPLMPVALNASTTQELKLIVAPKNPSSLLVTVKDAGTQLPLSEASVRLEKVGYDTTLITGRGFLRQTDWSGGEGQDDFIDETRYSTSDGNVDVLSPAGEVRLRSTFGNYEPTGSFISSIFDTGSASNFHQIFWQPLAQPPEAGADSVKFQIATNNDKTTWNYRGADGALGTFYTLADTNINSIHDGDRYIRYQAFLSTTTATSTPNLADVQFTFASSCVPPGQVFFSGLTNDDYTITVSKPGYQDFTDTVTVGAAWQHQEVTLTP